LGRMKIDVKNRFALGDKLEIIEPEGNQDLTLTEMWNLNGESIDVAPGSGHFVWIKLAIKTGNRAFIARYILIGPYESLVQYRHQSTKGFLIH